MHAVIINKRCKKKTSRYSKTTQQISYYHGTNHCNRFAQCAFTNFVDFRTIYNCAKISSSLDKSTLDLSRAL